MRFNIRRFFSCLLAVMVTVTMAMPAVYADMDDVAVAAQEAAVVVTSASSVEVEGENQEDQQLLEEMEENDAVLLFADEEMAPVSVEAADRDPVVLTYDKKIRYEGFFTRNFRVQYDGKTKVAYCIEPVEKPLAAGGQTAAKYDHQLMTKALYYSYGYPGYEARTKAYLAGANSRSTYKSDDGAYIMSHLVLSYIYDNKSADSDAFKGLSAGSKALVKDFAAAIESWPDVPDNSALKLNGTVSEAVWDKEKAMQTSAEFTLEGHSDNVINVPLPEGVTMVRTSAGATEQFSRAAGHMHAPVRGGDSFYFTAPAQVQGVFSTGIMTGSLQDFQAYRLCVSGKQDILFSGNGASTGVSLEVRWVDLGALKISKESAVPEITEGNGIYSLEGAVYQLLDSEGQLYGTLTTDEEGAAAMTVPYGEYIIVETKAPRGYGLDMEAYTVAVDSAETVFVHKEDIIRISTTAYNGENNGKLLTPAAEARLSDDVKYEGLTPGNTYMISGIVMDKTTGKPLMCNEKKVTGTREFTAENQTGTVTVDFTVDTRQLAGKELVVFETLYENGEIIAYHTDLNDTGQTVKVIAAERAPATGDSDFPWTAVVIAAAGALAILVIGAGYARKKSVK